ncbi:hypothetical protein [Clostridium sardiniense]|uniref:hypothetical protein n=1 Tax=Clostridium sardiniense TaxID=29369 RepID=UPI00195C7BD6|nr:hypothetical protein [Clostridium sardiniense]MBM7835579.1 cytoskeletal protein RodZ [Clostridium sardiniense]
MKKIIVRNILIVIVIIGVSVLGYNIYKFKSTQDTKSNTHSSTSESVDKNTLDKASSNDKKELAKDPKDESKKIDRSKTVDANKVEEVIMKKLPKGTITNLEFKNDSKNPHYDISVLSEGFKYEFEILLKDGSIKEIKKEKIEMK